MDTNSVYRYMQIRGHVADITEENAREHINILAGKYTDQAYFELNTLDEVRVIFKILPDQVDGH